VFGAETSEEHRPSLKQQKARSKSLPFYASIQHVKNAQLMLQCEECNMWRLIYSKHKLSRSQRTQLQQVLGDYTYTCGAKLVELNLGNSFKEVEVWDHLCGDPAEKLYYSAGFEPICVYCARDQPFTCADQYPQCPDCSHCPAVKK